MIQNPLYLGYTGVLIIHNNVLNSGTEPGISELVNGWIEESDLPILLLIKHFDYNVWVKKVLKKVYLVE